MPSFIRSLEQQGFVITQQARLSPELANFVDYGGFAVFREKAQTGVTLKDRAGEVLYFTASGAGVRRLQVHSPSRRGYPAVRRKSRTARRPINAQPGGRVGPVRRGRGQHRLRPVRGRRQAVRRLDPGDADREVPPFARRANQRHRRQTPADHDSERAPYQDGPDTMLARQRIVVDYVNSTPLSARAGFGEVIGGRRAVGVVRHRSERSQQAARGAAQGPGRARAGGHGLQAGPEPAARAAAALTICCKVTTILSNSRIPTWG